MQRLMPSVRETVLKFSGLSPNEHGVAYAMGQSLRLMRGQQDLD
jgi:hypothetical protein